MEACPFEALRWRHGIEGDFVLFAGRREWGKGWPELLSHLAFASSLLSFPAILATVLPWAGVKLWITNNLVGHGTLSLP